MIDQIIKQAQEKLLTADQFYNKCQEIKQKYQIDQLYFLIPDFILNSPYYNITLREWQLFFDNLAQYILNFSKIGSQTNFIFRRDNPHNLSFKPLKISLEIVGEGMIGRVAHLIINEEINLAFKVFFDPEFVWHHGNWAEIALGLYFKANQVTKDFSEFIFAGENWAVWEWIDEQEKPENRLGIYYHDFAKINNLNSLNYLNKDNYNPYLIRLDPGGIQTEYFGRRFNNLITSIIFYLHKIRQKGIKSLFFHIMRYNIKEYTLLLLSIFIPQKNILKITLITNNGHFRKCKNGNKNLSIK